MAQYKTLERIQMSAYRRLAAATQALPKDRKSYDQWAMTVTAVVDVAACVKRITFAADEFRDFNPLGADEYFGLLMPAVGHKLVLPDVNTINVRAAVQQIPEQQRPELRWYTVRTHRPEVGEIDVDIVTHGDSGPGSAWALAAQVGDQAGIRCGSASYDPPEAGNQQLLIGDETALPAIAAIADAVRAVGCSTDTIRALVEIPDEDHATPLDAPFEVTQVVRGTEKPGSLLVPTLQKMTLPELDYAWACGESALATGARRHLVKTLGMPRRSVMFSGYWKLGVARR